MGRETCFAANPHPIFDAVCGHLAVSDFTSSQVTISRILGGWASLDSRGLSENLGSSRSMAASSCGWVWQIRHGNREAPEGNSISDLFPAPEPAQRTSAPMPTLGLLPMEHLRFYSTLFTLAALTLWITYPRESSLPVTAKAGSGAASCCFQRSLGFLSF